MNYTEDSTAYIVNKYANEPSIKTVEKLAEELGKSTKSIIGKLSREGVYERAVYKNKNGVSPVTKAEICINIAENLGIEAEMLVGLEKSPKATLQALELATGIIQTIKAEYKIEYKDCGAIEYDHMD
tara:strand:- start:189 stop:569 length:381 start_codon:yes stop_codon:yes gene_type:complete